MSENNPTPAPQQGALEALVRKFGGELHDLICEPVHNTLTKCDYGEERIQAALAADTQEPVRCCKHAKRYHSPSTTGLRLTTCSMCAMNSMHVFQSTESDTQ